jgi:hypothetical protein
VIEAMTQRATMAKGMGGDLPGPSSTVPGDDRRGVTGRERF